MSKKAESMKTYAENLGKALGLNVTGITQTLSDGGSKMVTRVYVDDEMSTLLGERFKDVQIDAVSLDIKAKPKSNIFVTSDSDLPQWAVKLFAEIGSLEGYSAYVMVGFSLQRGHFFDVVVERLPLPPRIQVEDPDPLPPPKFVSAYTLSVLRRLTLGARLFCRHQHQSTHWYAGRDEHDPYSDEIDGDKLKADLTKEVGVFWGQPGAMVPMFDRPVLKWALLASHEVYNHNDCVIDEYTLDEAGKQFVKDHADA